MVWLKYIKIRYQWRLFAFITTIMYTTIIVAAIWIYNSERRLRIESVRNQIELVNSRIINACENNFDAAQFLQFVGHYYKAHPLFEHIRITLFHNGEPIESVGEPISSTEATTLSTRSDEPYRVTSDDYPPDDDYLALHQISTSADGIYSVATILPFNSSMLSQRFQSGIYTMLLVLALMLTIGAYMASRRLGRNVAALKEFAQRAGSDPDFDLQVEFANDELGDISRQILHIAQERNKTTRQLEHEHQVAIAALEEKNELKRQLANDLNHELKTPVAVIKGYADTIIQHPEMDQKSLHHFLEKITVHADRLAYIIQAQAYINSLESGSLPFKIEPVNIYDIAMQAAADLSAAGFLSDINFLCNLPKDCTVNANARVVNAILSNLIKNTAIHSHGSQCILEIDHCADGFIFFRFCDNGVGVPPQHLNKIFERFYRIDAGRSRQSGGSGLGLPIVKAAVNSLGGSITAENRVDTSGLQFTFSLPDFSPK